MFSPLRPIDEERVDVEAPVESHAATATICLQYL